MIRVTEHRAEQKVSGFQSPAADYLEGRLNITDLLIADPHCTYYFQMDSNAMTNNGLNSGDLLIIDRSVKPVTGAIVIAFTGGAFYCRKYELEKGKPVLIGDNDRIKLNAEEPFQVWGVVTFICRNTLPNGLKKGNSHVCTM